MKTCKSKFKTMKYANIFIIIGAFLVFNCEPEALNNKNNSKERYEDLIQEGKKYFEAKIYDQALESFLRANQLTGSGESSYLSGNTSMNLKKYKNAIEYYIKSFEKNYQKHNSIFNIACAHSLDGNTYMAFIALLTNYKNGDRQTSRIEKDSDLNNFRNSKHKQAYYDIIGALNEGVVPKSKSDILKYLFKFNAREDTPDTSVNYDIIDDPSPGTIRFNKNNTFYLFGGTVPFDVGTWELDDEKKIFKIERIGRVIPKEYADQSGIRYMDKYYDKEKKLVFIKEFKEKIIDEIPYEKIRLNVVELSTINMEPLFVAPVNYNRFGNLQENKVLTGVIGWYLDQI